MSLTNGDSSSKIIVFLLDKAKENYLKQKKNRKNKNDRNRE